MHTISMFKSIPINKLRSSKAREYTGKPNFKTKQKQNLRFTILLHIPPSNSALFPGYFTSFSYSHLPKYSLYWYYKHALQRNCLIHSQDSWQYPVSCPFTTPFLFFLPFIPAHFLSFLPHVLLLSSHSHHFLFSYSFFLSNHYNTGC